MGESPPLSFLRNFLLISYFSEIHGWPLWTNNNAVQLIPARLRRQQTGALRTRRAALRGSSVVLFHAAHEKRGSVTPITIFSEGPTPRPRSAVKPSPQDVKLSFPHNFSLQRCRFFYFFFTILYIICQNAGIKRAAPLPVLHHHQPALTHFHPPSKGKQGHIGIPASLLPSFLGSCCWLTHKKGFILNLWLFITFVR